MTDAGADGPPGPGLRERKKARTRRTLQEQALRLFREQGYAETTIEQIAEAADVSPATVYRYFPTKPDLVIYDDLDDRLIAAVRAQPKELGTVDALRSAIGGAFGSLVGVELEVQRERERLIRTEPELRATMLDELAKTLNEVTDLVSERTGRAADDGTVLALSGAVIGVVIAAWLGSTGDDWVAGFLRQVDTGLRLLETGFDL